MGKIVLAATCIYAPSILMSEQDGPVKGKPQAAIDGRIKITSRATERGVGTAIICVTRSMINTDYPINEDDRFKGVFTSAGPSTMRNRKCEAVIEYFQSSGTGRTNVIFPVQ